MVHSLNIQIVLSECHHAHLRTAEFVFHCSLLLLCQALFFAVNVGLGVGYGENSVRQPSSFAFTIGFVIVGASFIAAVQRAWLGRAH